MPEVKYLTLIDRIQIFDTYKPTVMDMTRTQLQVVILMILNGSDVDYAFDKAMSMK